MAQSWQATDNKRVIRNGKQLLKQKVIMGKHKHRKRFRVNTRDYDSEQVVKSMTALYRPLRKLPEAKPVMKFSTKNKEK